MFLFFFIYVDVFLSIFVFFYDLMFCFGCVCVLFFVVFVLFFLIFFGFVVFFCSDGNREEEGWVFPNLCWFCVETCI